MEIYGIESPFMKFAEFSKPPVARKKYRKEKISILLFIILRCVQRNCLFVLYATGHDAVYMESGNLYQRDADCQTDIQSKCLNVTDSTL